MKKGKKWMMLLFGIIISGILWFFPLEMSKEFIRLHIDISSETEQIYQVFYSNNYNFTEEQSKMMDYNFTKKVEELEIELPRKTKVIRIDLGEQQGRHIISKFMLTYGERVIFNSISLEEYITIENMISSCQWNKEDIVIDTNGSDSFFVLDFSKLDLESKLEELDEINRKNENIRRIIVFIVLYSILCFVIFKYYGLVKAYLLSLLHNRAMILDFSKNDFKIKYAGSYLGTVWAFIQPIVTIAVYWFVFQVGFRSGNVVEECPFILWLISGLVPWFFFVEALSSGTNCLLDYNYLVKKVVFPIHTLPVIRICATYYIHLFFMLFSFLIFFVYGFYPQVYWIQLIYSELCMLIMLIGLVYMTSALVVFFKDLSQIIVIVVQIGLWLTPILWNYTSVINNKTLAFILKLNPMFYIIEQYRNALIYHKWFLDDFYWTVYFWSINLALLGIGLLLFQKLKVHFADVI